MQGFLIALSSSGDLPVRLPARIRPSAGAFLPQAQREEQLLGRGLCRFGRLRSGGQENTENSAAAPSSHAAANPDPTPMPLHDTVAKP